MDKRYVISLMIAIGCIGSINSQTLEEAKRWFNEGKFAEAKPVFQQLVKKAPSNANYNFWYGACCFETGDLDESQPYLEKSAARKVINAYLYLGKLYYEQYRFDDAVSNVEEHISWLEKKKRDTEEAEKVLAKCRMGARMIRNTEKITVVDSFVVDKASFLSAYKLDKSCGRICMEDNGTSTSYSNEWEDRMILAQRGPDGETHLYSRMKLIDKWSEPQYIEGINEEGCNQNYPFVNADGITLYYASEGEGSLGGYDIFITRYDSDNDTYLRANNIGMPFNSPANDYLYAIDEQNQLGWFVSDRYQPEGKVCVYVFVPNESREVHDYTDTDAMVKFASLKEIKSTWTSDNTVQEARQRLAQVMYAEESRQHDTEFRFIVDDEAVYERISDFTSDEAREEFRLFQQKEKDLASLQQELDNLRTTYSQSDKGGKQRLAPGILDKEGRVKALRDEIEAIATHIRHSELEALKQ